MTVPSAVRRLTPFAGVLLAAAAMWALDRELAAMRYPDLVRALAGTSSAVLGLAVVLTATNYFVLTLHDQLAFVYLGRAVERWRIALASFVGYAVSNSVGFALLSGTSARYRFYARWGLSADEVSRVVIFYSSTFWLGLLTLGSWSLLTMRDQVLVTLGVAGPARLAGLAMGLAAAAWALTPLAGLRTIRLGRRHVDVPSARLVAGQFLVSTADWALAASVLWVLLPSPRPPFGELAAAFLAAQLLGLASHVPGGIGVFESLMVLLLSPWLPVQAVLPALLLYRLVYYLVPLVVALGVLLGDELVQRRATVHRVTSLFGALAVEWTPRLLAALCFAGGAVLLFSGATPAEAGRLAILHRWLPLPLVEASHFAGSLAGIGLILLSHGLARRLDAAYYLAVVGLVAGIAASLFKGLDYEEAALLTVLLACLAPARANFDRRASFFESRLSPAWTAAVFMVLAATGWLVLFSFRHVQYRDELWWQFTLHGEASRSLRASVGIVMTMAVFGATRLLRSASPVAAPPTDAELARAQAIVDGQPYTSATLVFLRDKALLWSDDGTAFLMYAVQGRTWVAMGDPVGPPARHAALIERFIERADDYEATPVFYEVRQFGLHRYADRGLTFVKLGEEARVPLDTFTLEGSRGAKGRQAIRKLEREGATFRVLDTEEVAAVMPRLREISDAWLRAKSVAEKGFSLGFFDEDYVRRFPAAVIEQRGRIVAFATVWPSPQREELSVDLMRHADDAPGGVMDGLFFHLLAFGREQGYAWFNLGMAPLSGFESSQVAPLWIRLGAWLQKHGGRFYNFQGLRAYKEKFAPVWEPRYLAYPGGLGLPRILADVAALVAGGYRRIFTR
ncbi:MAG: bifunctional lysylphosphatidylglycerol flippase/synthetase MprF [Vicinamibacterales bacterium]